MNQPKTTFVNQLGHVLFLGLFFSFSYWFTILLAQIIGRGFSLTIHAPSMSTYPLHSVGLAFCVFVFYRLASFPLRQKYGNFLLLLVETLIYFSLTYFFIQLAWSGHTMARLESNFGFLFFKGKVFEVCLITALSFFPSLWIFINRHKDLRIINELVLILTIMGFIVGFVLIINQTQIPKVKRAALMAISFMLVPLLNYSVYLLTARFSRYTDHLTRLRKPIMATLSCLIVVLFVGKGLTSTLGKDAAAKSSVKKGLIGNDAIQLENFTLNALQTCVIHDSQKPLKKLIGKDEVLIFSYGASHDSLEKEKEIKFKILAQDGDGLEVQLFNKVLKYSQSEKNPGWINERVTLTQFEGKKLEIKFQAGDGGLFGAIRAGNFKRSLDEYNVIFLSLDTLRADRLGISGYFRDTSPNIDRIASNGVYFREAISQSPWTLPSHMSVFTGLHPSYHGMMTPLSGTLSNELVTIPKVFQEKGYITQAFSGSAAMAADFGFYKGFDRYMEANGHISSDAKFIFGQGMNWLEKHRKEKFFLFLHTYEIHAPFIHAHFSKDLPPGTPEQEQLDAVYDGGIYYTDQYVGRLKEKLEELNLLSNTLLVIFSDHGEDLYQRYSLEHGHTLYDEIIRVPLIFNFPSFKPRIINHYQAQHIDIVPTVLDFFGFNGAISGLKGQSLMPILMGGQPKPRSIAISEAVIYGPDCKSIRYVGPGQREKYIFTPYIPPYQIAFPPVNDLLGENSDYTYQDAQWVTLVRESKGHQFYNLEIDPEEAKNIYYSSEATKSETNIIDRLKGYLESTPKHDKSNVAEMDEDLKEKLKSLGYL